MCTYIHVYPIMTLNIHACEHKIEGKDGRKVKRKEGRWEIRKYIRMYELEYLF